MSNNDSLIAAEAAKVQQLFENLDAVDSNKLAYRLFKNFFKKKYNILERTNYLERMYWQKNAENKLPVIKKFLTKSTPASKKFNC